MRETRPGTFNGLLTILAGFLLSLLLTGSAWALTATDCATCHGADVVEGHHDTTDPNSLFNQGLCNQCHVGVTTSGDCTTCHAATGLNNKHHIPPTGQTSINCAQCHTGAGDPRNCSSCHQGEVPQNFHHTQLTAPIYYVNGKLNCAGCHPGATLTSNCQACHNATTGADPRTQHHSYTDDAGNKPACNSCHAQLKTTFVCQDCHAPRAKMPEHHALTGAPPKPGCGICHNNLSLGFGLLQTDIATTNGCKDCHQSASEPLHHDTVRVQKNFTCGQCHTNAVAISGCESCHINAATPDTQAIHHNGTAYAGGNCGTCHTSSGLSDPGCGSCHDFIANNLHHDSAYVYGKYAPSIDGCTDCHVRGTYQIAPDNCTFCHEGIVKALDIQPKHHADAAATSGNCAACHTGMSNPTGPCAACHSSTGPQPATSGTHHAAATANNKLCADCHTGISKPASCATCHTSGSTGTTSSRHHALKDSSSNLYDCAKCHGGADQIYQSCRSCHEELNEGATPAQYHHMTTVYTTGPCATCHQTTDGTSLQRDCTVCHLGTGKPSIATQHHATDSYLTGSCTECHNSTAPAAIPCAGCHSSTVSTHHSQTVTVGTTVTPKPCRDCHSTIQLVGGSCEGCHTAPIPQLHHGDPLTAVNGNCAVCHQSVSSPGSCSTCHTTTSHHISTWSTSGDCAHCHIVPASAVDRPAQAACRECHGTDMHDKGGPIQNYGICAACHNTTPFHAYNTGNTGDTWNYSRDDRDRGGSGPGYNKFNMFVSQNSRRRGEEGREAPRNKLNFSTKTISHAGRSYTVPYFTAMPSSNLALGKTASASRTESGYGAALSVDGNTTTRWWAKSTSAQWLKVDLGAAKSISKVTLRWHSYYAKSYQIQVSTDNSTWTTVFSNTYGAGGMETRTFTARSVRYIRINCQSSSSSNGYSIYELEAYAR